MVIGVYHREPEEMTVPKRYPGPGSNRRAYAFIRSCKAYRCGHQLRGLIHEKKMKKKMEDTDERTERMVGAIRSLLR